ncbi:RNA polymerase factor sigma-54 [Fodinibius salsisoli]|uniref:RNA polymerase factor sigma-54 n=1 Tax=Fodinibius salsisoli TaxID=2820877 RepID=A0ABT3PPC5_9BACT|nr:RNA polymerase factor sigma-54 [Fodinibius salsisoli]MCW9707714.1 RNA polymerase factor sigma-54 [Fodinibius salsisoli]
MLKTGQQMNQKQTQKQRLSPQQIQYIKLLQLPTVALEQRIKEELEANPVLEEGDPSESLEELESSDWEAEADEPNQNEELEPVDQKDEVDWDEFMQNTDYEGEKYSGGSGYSGNQEWRDLPDPYHESFLEELEQQVGLLDLDEEQKLIADQILGSLDQDGYFRREIEAVVDNIAFNKGVLTNKKEVEKVRRQIQRLDPPGVASRDLRDCLLIQLKLMEHDAEGKKNAIAMLRDHWKLFEKKHFKKLKKKLGIDNEELKSAFDCVKGLDPKPGGGGNAVDDTQNYIEPDFEVYYQPAENEEYEDGEAGDFVISLNNSNVPPLHISPRYKQMWDDLKKKKKQNKQTKETKSFIKNKIESAQWFIDSIRQRQNTLMNTMQTIVALQEDFFKHGEGLKPMILKDIAERVNLDISTISRVVNGKYVQTHFGVFELKYFFSEGLETESGEEVSSREVKNAVQDIVDNEDKDKPLSDQAIADLLQGEGYKVARRTVSKYREKLNIPVARLRKQII